MYLGSCLCGAVSYKLLSEPTRVSHCHCRMCQKQHGAAFATYGTLSIWDFVYLSGDDQLGEFVSSEGVSRKFCKVCGSNIEWTSRKYPGETSFTLATLDTPFMPDEIVDIYTDRKACWLIEH